MYPVELFVDFDDSLFHWFQWLFDDAAYLQCSLSIASATFDAMSHSPTTERTYSHLRKAILLLNQSLSSSDATISLGNSTVAAVFKLAMFSCMVNDHAAAKAHVAGLRQMVRLCGGLGNFQNNTKLCMKLGRCVGFHLRD